MADANAPQNDADGRSALLVPTFTSRRVERAYIRFAPDTGTPVALAFRMVDGTKVLYPLYESHIYPSPIAMNPNMPMPIEPTTDQIIEQAIAAYAEAHPDMDMKPVLDRLLAAEVAATLVRSDVSDLQTSVLGQEEAFELLEGLAYPLAARVNSIEGKMVGYDKLFSQLQTVDGVLGEQIQGLRVSFAELQESLRAHQGATTELRGRVTKLETSYADLYARLGVAEADVTQMKKNGQLRCGNLTKTVTKILSGTEDFVVPLSDGGFTDDAYNAVCSIRDVSGILGSVSQPVVIAQTATTCTVRVQATGVITNKQVRVNVVGRRYVTA